MTVTPFEIKLICPLCKGTGIVGGEQGTTKPCTFCDASSGFIFSGTVDGIEQMTDLTDKVNDCLDKLNDILELLH